MERGQGGLLETAMPGRSSWMTYGPQGVKGFDDDDDVVPKIHNSSLTPFI